jgi:NAD(P)-dependent dehydrogenase (short-subunit alcohol dehydrogenase family)
MDRSVVVTGAGGGIGHAIATRLKADGWRVVGLELSAETSSGAEDCCDRIVIGDVAEVESHREAASVARTLAPLAGWVNNAGIGKYTPLHALDESVIRRIIDVNGAGYLWGASAAVSAFIEQRTGGSLVNIGSIHGRSSFVDHAAYEFTKGGVDAMSRSVAVTYGRYGIRSNTIAPGGVRTPLLMAQNAVAPDPEAAERGLREGPPMHRIAEPEEIAAVAAFLLSDEASYVSGQSIAVDGAWTASFGVLPANPELDARYGIDQ